MTGNRGRWVVLGTVTAAGLLVDWGTKLLVLENITQGERRPVLGDALQWTLAYNPGGLFGSNPSTWIPGFPSALFYMVVSVLLILLLVMFYRRLDPILNRFAMWGLILVMPGALGNFVDRALGRPGVVDFIRVDLGFWPLNPWPIFNVADILISVGAGLLLLDMVVNKVRAHRGGASGR